MIVHTKADGKTQTNTYGIASRDFLTQITYSNGEAPRTMAYDALGKLLTATNAHAAITRTYDLAGRQTGETQALSGGLTGTFAYQYDADGNLARHTRPDGSFIDYAWNARNLLAGITADAPPPLATYTYNGRNQLSATVTESGLFTAARSYDAAGRLTGVSNGALDSTGYTLSADGRRTAIDRNGVGETYGYDNARQVTSAGYGGGVTDAYSYDAAGNRSAYTRAGGLNPPSQTYTINSVNEYTSIAGLPANPAHDANGNATTWNILPPASGVLASASFTWDINNQLIYATDNNTGDSASYQHDALGRRTKRTETIGGIATSTWFFSNGWNVELEHDGTAFVRRLSWGLDLSGSLQGAGGVGGLVMTEELPPGGAAPVPHFPTYDGNGNITAWVDASGTLVARQRYDAYGNLIAQTGTTPCNYGFSTKPQDQVTGLLYYGYRYYDPVTGRWPSRDPIWEWGGFNLYEFVGNNPNSWIDVKGKFGFVGALGGAIGGAIGGVTSAIASGGSAGQIIASGVAGGIVGGIVGLVDPTGGFAAAAIGGAVGGFVGGAITGGAQGAVVGAAVGGVAGLAAPFVAGAAAESAALGITGAATLGLLEGTANQALNDLIDYLQGDHEDCLP